MKATASTWFLHNIESKCIFHDRTETGYRDFSQIVSKCYRRRLFRGLPVVYNANKALKKSSLLARGNASHLITSPYLQQAVHTGYLPLAHSSQKHCDSQCLVRFVHLFAICMEAFVVDE